MRLVNHAFEAPVTVPPQIAEDYEGVDEAARRGKGKVKIVAKPKVRAHTLGCDMLCRVQTWVLC